MISLYEYQENLVKNIAVSLVKGNHPVIGQLPTGGGKTVCFSSIIQRFLTKTPDKRVLIMVHRQELRTQAANTLKNLFKIKTHEIIAGDKYVPNANVYVGLVQTIKNRLELLPEIDMVIVDECHLNHFSKVV